MSWAPTAADWLAAAVALIASVDMAKAHCVPGHYRNVSGRLVHRPECVAAGVHLEHETATCRDGLHSLSEHRQGTCSHHGGVDHFE